VAAVLSDPAPLWGVKIGSPARPSAFLDRFAESRVTGGAYGFSGSLLNSERSRDVRFRQVRNLSQITETANCAGSEQLLVYNLSKKSCAVKGPRHQCS
jgi:hypothetical protein